MCFLVLLNTRVVFYSNSLDLSHNIYRLLESIVLDRGPLFIAEITRKLNNMLRIETKLLTFFHLQINRQTEYINQKLEQYF